MNERVVTFGKEGHLVGIVAAPDAGREDPGHPGVILLNVGMLHRIGPFRLTVELSRRLAELGFAALRFDLSGLGDSMPRRRTAEEPEAADICEAMDFMSRTRKIDRFVIWGLCTGAVGAHRAAVRDERVCGVVCIDGYAYRTARFFASRYRRFVMEPRELARFLVWLLRHACTARQRARQDAVPYVGDEYFGWRLPGKEQAETEYRGLVDRGVRMLCLYSGDSQVRSRYNYTGQFKDMFPSLAFGPCMADELIREGDHIFSQLPARERLMDRICRWMESNFGRTGPVTAAAPRTG